MELEHLNSEQNPPGEEQGDKGARCGACINCDRIHTTVSNWMLPEDARATYLERANCLPPPLFIIAISVAELAVFVYYAAWNPPPQWITMDPSVWESPFVYRADKREEAWRFVSYMLVHAGIEHILGNLVLQLFLGIPLELVHKGLRVGLVYIAGVIGGSLASSVCDPHMNLVGASGGVYALIGGYFMNVLVNFHEMIPLLGVARLLLIFIIVGTDVGFALYRRFLSPADGLQVSFVAHLAGGLAGMSVGYVIFSSFDKNFIKDPRFWVSTIAYFVFVVFAVLFNVFFSTANQ
uniref:Rhomboid-related protein 2 n=1 Tax=Salvator merianae TaxID=96440 RepID=A0A8D0AZE2_SALMN